MLRLAFDFIITWRETRTRPNAYGRKDKRNIKNTRYYILNKAKECFEHAAQLGHSLAGSKARQVEGEMSRL